MPEIRLSQVKLRTIKKKDYLDMFDYGKRKEVVKFLSWGPFVLEKEALYSIKKIFLPRLKQGLPIGYAIIDLKTDKMIGTIDFHSKQKHENGAEIGYVLHPDYWNRGIMSEALNQMIEIGFKHLKYDFIRIRHLKENVQSGKVIAKTPFRYVKSEPFVLEKSYEILKDEMLYYELSKENYDGNQQS